MDTELGPPQLAETLRLLVCAAPHIAESHMAEALARGVRPGSGPDRPVFEGVLAGHGYSLNRLQVTLLDDAVRLALGVAWRLPARPDGKGLERCTHCRDDFWSDGPHNLVCATCKIRQGSVPGVHHAAWLCDMMVFGAFHCGTMPDYAGSALRARPGWADVLDGPDLRARVYEWLGYREVVGARRWDDLPAGQRFLIDRFGETSYLRLFKWDVPAQWRAA